MTFSDNKQDKPDTQQYRQFVWPAIAAIEQKTHAVPLSEAIRSDHATSESTRLNFPSVTLNFHPDQLCRGSSVVQGLLRDGVYQSQFESGISNGSVSSHVGGQRWQWEQTIFEHAYDDAPAALRPKYGALNFTGCEFGAAPRFGSAHLILKKHVLERCTFAYPDSHLNPKHFGTLKYMPLIPMAELNELGLEPLDSYIEAHVHGVVNLNLDVEAIVLDPSYRNTAVEAAAQKMPMLLKWHSGYTLLGNSFADCEQYRGRDVAELIQRIAVNNTLTPAIIGEYRGTGTNEQLLKKAWHCVARFGGPHNA